jgi:hypothetical protein
LKRQRHSATCVSHLRGTDVAFEFLGKDNT